MDVFYRYFSDYFNEIKYNIFSRFRMLNEEMRKMPKKEGGSECISLKILRFVKMAFRLHVFDLLKGFSLIK